METFFGIDYGSKLSGNTVIAVLQEHQVMFLDIAPKVDADMFIRNAIGHFKPELVFMDAPLSIPAVYTNTPGFNNYHYRVADIETKAMSPMFLGGLVARAMELKGEMEQMGIEVFETYPRLMANRFNLKEIGYKSSRSALRECALQIKECLKEPIKFTSGDIATWNHLDALLALMSAMSFRAGDYHVYGDPEEGLIYV